MITWEVMQMSDKVYSIDELKEKMQEILSEFAIEEAILFGSYAKGVADEKSDIDLVVRFPEKFSALRFFGLLEILTTTLEKPIDLIEYSDIVKDGKIEKELLKTGVVIYGK